MRKNLLGLDHAVLRVANLDGAAEAFVAMGFKLSSRGRHTLGTENRCVMFGFDYLELLWVPPGVEAPFYAGTSGAEGMTALAFKSDDVAGLHQVWTKDGLDPADWVEFSRAVEVGQDRTQDARFRAVALPASRTPGGRAFAVEHLTPELVWRPGSSRHPNQVTGINKIVVAAEDPAAVALAWARIVDVPRHPVPGGIAVNTGAAPIVVLTPAALARQLPGVELPALDRGPAFGAIYLSCGDLKIAASLLQAHGLQPIALADGSLGISADRARGVALVLK